MAKKTKEDINLDEIDENFIISSFKTPGKPQTPVANSNKVETAEQQEIPKEQMKTEQPQADEEQQTTARTKEKQETGKGKKKGLLEYGEKFLKRNELKTRQCVYISQPIHTIISRLVHVIADKDITVGGYIDIVLAEHLERHKDEINELYRQRREDLI